MSGDLPDYKLTFLKEMEAIRQREAEERDRAMEQSLPQPQGVNAPKIENNIINTSQYSSGVWKQHLNQTYYQRNHDEAHHQLNLLVNPQIAKKQHNIQLTPISEYSNAIHNKTVFVNPKNISC